MDFIPFYKCFPDIALRETYILTVSKNDAEVPEGDYFVIENYCLDKTCDCCKVMINVIPKNSKHDIFATIGFGWESLEFYRKWAYGDNEIAIMMEGTHVEIGGIQSKYTRFFLEQLNLIILQDKDFTGMIKRHYRLFKNMLEKLKSTDFCPCGCGRKYRRYHDYSK